MIRSDSPTLEFTSSSSPPSYPPVLWFPPSHRTYEMSITGPNPYAAMELPTDVDMVRKESQELQQLQLREIELATSNSIFGAALDLHVREKDKADVAKLKQAAMIGGGAGPKT